MKKFLLYIFCAVVFTSCKKFVDVGTPSTQLSAATIFNSDATATAAQLAIYASMEGDGLAYNQIIYCGVSADELTNYDYNNFSIDLATNNLTADNYIVLTHWLNFYKYIYQANAVLEGLAASSSLSEPIKKQLEGEAMFVRAFCHFYLVNLYGDIPFARSTDYRENAKLSRSTVSEVYSFIEQDLKMAIDLLSVNYLGGNNKISVERVRPNQFAAKALLSRVYLYMGKWPEAEMQATDVIANNSMYDLTDLNEVFLKNSKEAIWQWQSIVPEFNSYPGAQLILYGTPYVVSLDSNFIKSFQATDNRQSSWIGLIEDGGVTYHYPAKYKAGQNEMSITEYTMVLRLSEQYLIRSEARIMQYNLAGAESDLNTIRNRAGLASINGLDKTTLLSSIQEERKFELFAEFGDRWLNLKRSGMATAVLSIVKGSNWNPTDALYPIPLSEINKNRNLTQNLGY